MKCTDDKERDAIGVCTRCGKAVCPKDAVIIDGKLYCKECAEKVRYEETHPKTLHRSLTNRAIAGVCGGLGEYLGIDPTVIRIIFVLLMFLPHFSGFFTMILIYILLWIVMPEGEHAK